MQTIVMLSAPPILGLFMAIRGGFSFHMHLPYFRGMMEVLILIKLGISAMRTQYRVSRLRISIIDSVVHVLLKSYIISNAVWIK